MRTAAIQRIGKATKYTDIQIQQESTYFLNDINHKDKFSFANYIVNNHPITCAGNQHGDAYCITTKKSTDIHNGQFQKDFCYQTIFHSNLNHLQQTFFYNNHNTLHNIAINADNYYSVVTFSNYDGYPDSGNLYNNTDHEIWVTASSDFQKKVKRLICPYIKYDTTDIAIRLNELLGLPPDDLSAPTPHVVTALVPGKNNYKAYGLFRPCMSGYDTTEQCHPIPTAEETTTDYYTNWAMNHYLQANTPTQETLWTGQGYTYDWGSTDNKHIGLPEYIIAKHTPIFIAHNDLLPDYIQHICH